MITKYFIAATTLFLLSCTLPEEKSLSADMIHPDTVKMQETRSYNATHTEAEPLLIKPAVKIKKPSGIYQAVLPLHGNMMQTVAFYNDFTYQLQEAYHINKKDSIIMTLGNWTPSDGFIWLYKDQVVRGRYKWKGDILQYFSPVTRKSFPMTSMPDAMDNQSWQQKKKNGVLLFGVGNEPFWSIEHTSDTLSFLLADWKQPIQMKINHTVSNPDSTAYTAINDSTQLNVTVFPYFCNDGMSDFVYKNKVRVQYNNQTYNGCALLFK